MKTRFNIFQLILLLSLLILSTDVVLADSMRCKNNLVRSGDTAAEVRIQCGEPFDKEYVGRVHVKGKYVNVDRYTYVPAKGQFIKILEFHDGKLAKILNGKRV